MASYNLLIVLAIASVIILPCMAATEFWVGGASGWTTNFDYQAWASDKEFHVGDSLVFNYTQGVHNVFKVNGTAFADCIKPAANLALTTGRDVVTLASPGKKWYICGVKTHCSELKQKLVIDVKEAVPAPAPAPTSSARGLFSSSYQVFVVAAVALGMIAAI